MKLETLLQILDRANRSDLAVNGRYGAVRARPDGMCHPQTGEPTYRVDAEYLQDGRSDRTRVQQRGFRFSTVCCLCAAVCMGETNLDQGVLSVINRQYT